jgi:hypothetical protein
MGRYNNKRTQQAAAALQNTPARARFSKGPPPRKTNKSKDRTTNGSSTTTTAASTTATTANGTSTPKQRATAVPNQAVVDKMKRRMVGGGGQGEGGTPNGTVVASTDEQALQLLLSDVTKYDQLTLSNHALFVITNLLTDLGIVNHSSSTPNNNPNNNKRSSSSNGSGSGTRNKSGNDKAENDTTLAMDTEEPEDEEDDKEDNENVVVDDEEHDEGDNDYDEDEDDEDDILLQDWATPSSDRSTGGTARRNDDNDSTNRVVVTGRDYEEYEEDADEEIFVEEVERVRMIGGEDDEIVEWEGVNGDGDSSTQKKKKRGGVDDTIHDAKDDDQEHEEEELPSYDELQENATFIHLTHHLSFSQKDAARACHAVEQWNLPGSNTVTMDNILATDTNNHNDNSAPDKTKKKTLDSKEQLSLAMDWLCLHLEDATLTSGFRLNKDKTNNVTTNNKASLLLSARGIPLVGSGLMRAIPHPSISVAKPLTSDKEWIESVRLQERIVQFLRLGFLHSEASQACSNSSSSSSGENGNASQDDIWNDPALFRLLSILEQKATNKNSSKEKPTSEKPAILNQTDLDYAAEERKQEREALSAIYDNQFQILARLTATSPTKKTSSLDRYSLSVAPPEGAIEGAGGVSWENSSLLVICRLGYPVVEPPLLLFQNTTCPPALLRRINHHLAIRAQESLGAPAVFEIVSYLSESLTTHLDEFLKEQQEEQQNEKSETTKAYKKGSSFGSSRNSSSNNNNNDTNTDDDDYFIDEMMVDGKPLGRRQRAKLKAAEKSYQSGEKLEQWQATRRERQDARLDRIKQEQGHIRQSMAERAIAKRQEENARHEAERAARSVMNDALNRGVPVEEARVLSQQARVETLHEHGIHGNEEEKRVESTKGTNIGSVKSGTNNDKSATRPLGGIESNNGDMTPAAAKDTGDNRTQATPTSASFMARLQNKVNQGGLQNPPDTKAFVQPPEATPTTAAFMDRLRQMYEKAAQAKAMKGQSTGEAEDSSSKTLKPNAGKGQTTSEPELEAYHLVDPDLDKEDKRAIPVRLPRPVAVPTGELADVMKDVISQQRDQPWLVFPEARAPTVTMRLASSKDGEDSQGGDRIVVTPEQLRRQREISKKLRQELERKRKSAESWSAENGNEPQPLAQQKRSGGFNKNNGFTPQKFCAMMTTRQRYVRVPQTTLSSLVIRSQGIIVVCFSIVLLSRLPIQTSCF